MRLAETDRNRQRKQPESPETRDREKTKDRDTEDTGKMNPGAETARKNCTKIKVKRDIESEEHRMSAGSRRKVIKVDGEVERGQRRDGSEIKSQR